MSLSQDYFTPSASFWKDVRWWEQVAPHLNYQAMMVTLRLGPSEAIEVDACLRGVGGVNHISKEYFLLPVPHVIKGMPIHCTEMGVLMLAVDTWSQKRDDPLRPGVKKSLFQSTKVSIMSDNQAVIKAINFGHAKDEFLCIGMRYIHYQMALIDGEFALSYINTKDNKWADGLSRGDEGIEKNLAEKGYQRILISQNRLKERIDIDI